VQNALNASSARSQATRLFEEMPFPVNTLFSVPTGETVSEAARQDEERQNERIKE
jgi:hypothetical protein